MSLILNLIRLFLILQFFCKISDCAKILAVYPTPSYSHQIVFRPLTLELVNRGHNVTVITTDPIFPKGNSPENLKEIDVSFSYKSMGRFQNMTKGSDEYHDQIQMYVDVMTALIQEQLMSKEVKQLVETEKKFDLLIVEGYFRMCWSLAHVYEAPLVFLNSFGSLLDTYQALGVPLHTVLYPQPYLRNIYNLTFWKTVENIVVHEKHKKFYASHEEVENQIVKKIFPQATTFSDLLKKIEVYMANIHPMWEGNRPVTQNVIHVGSLNMSPEKDLPEALQNFLDRSSKGVIYFSLGTNVRTSHLASEKMRMFLKVLSQLPYDVLLKWDKESLPIPAKNIKFGKWFPQTDILRHKNVKLFITQGGQQSLDEAIRAAVPMLGIPLVIDQWQNVEKMVHHGIAVQLDMLTVTETDFKSAINAVIEHDSYRDNIVKLRSLMLDQPESPVERAVWWTEYVIRHGGAKHLRAPAANITWTQYYEIELIAWILIVVFSFFGGLSFLAYWSLKKFIFITTRSNKARKLI